MKTQEHIKESVLFKGLEGSVVSKIASISNVIEKEKNEILFSEDEEADALYILISGSVFLVKSSISGKEQLVRKVGKGEMFAEAAMFSGQNYPVTAIIKQNSKLIVITKIKLQKLIALHPEIALKIMGVMSGLLRHLNQLVSDLSLSSVDARLAKFILNKYQETNSLEFKIGMPKKDLALRLSTISETLSRTFNKFTKKGIISIKKDQIRIKNLDALEELVD